MVSCDHPSSPSITAQAGDPPEQVLFIDKGCANCHGIPPSVAGTQLDAAGEITQMRTPRGRMGAYTPDQISDAEITQTNTWLRGLPWPAAKPQAAQATATPASPPAAAAPGPSARAPRFWPYDIKFVFFTSPSLAALLRRRA